MNNTTTIQIPRNCFNVSGRVMCRVFPPPMSPEVQELIELDKTLQPIFTIMSLILLSIALIGNLLIIMTILKDPRIHGMAHVFLLNIAVADVLYAMVNIAGETLYIVLTPKQLQSKLLSCDVFRPMITVRFACYGAAVFSLAVLSVERWYAICQPFAAARNTSYKKRIKFASVLGIWVVSFGISSPLSLCTYGHERAQVIILAMSYLVIPFMIILIANGKIIISIKKAGVFVVSRKVGQETQRRRKHLLKLLFAIIISFVVLWVPSTAFYIYMGFFKAKDYVVYYRVLIISRVLGVTTYAHPALNSFMYYGFCKDFRRGLASLMRRSTSQTNATT